jgi:hypothetical protein
MKPTDPHPATIIDVPSRDNGWYYRVKTDHGVEHLLAGAGAPKGGKVGDLGTVAYQSGAGWGMWFWTPQRED